MKHLIIPANQSAGGLDLEGSRLQSEVGVQQSAIGAAAKQVQVKEDVVDLTQPAYVRNRNGSMTKVIMLDTAAYSGLNPVVRIAFDNTAMGGVVETVRIGGVVALAGAGARHGIGAGGADSATLVDQTGAGALRNQAFSELANFNNVILDKIKIVSATLAQLNTSFTHNLLAYDGTVHPTTNEVSATTEKSDDTTTLAVVVGQYILSAENYIEYSIAAGVTVTWSMFLSLVSSTESFTSLKSNAV
jgi:hypothetical protein